MNHIFFATKADITEIHTLMHATYASMENKDWYVTDNEEFLERHIGREGYILKYIDGGKIVAFLVVRHPGNAEDNLGRELSVSCGGGSALEPLAGMPVIEEAVLAKVAHMESVVVAPSHRGQGLQGKLLKSAEELERTRGTGFLMATVHPDNVYSLGNLLRAGYECILETEKYGGLPRKVLCKKLGRKATDGATHEMWRNDKS